MTNLSSAKGLPSLQVRESLLLLDTDVFSLMGRRPGAPGLRPWLTTVGIHRLCISFPVVTELVRGAHLIMHDDPRKAAAIHLWIKKVLAIAFPRADMSPEVASVYAQMTSLPCLKPMWTIQKDQRSSRMGHDLMIAAVAITHRLPIISANVPDYLRINEHFTLPGLYHPLEAQWHLRPRVRVSLPCFDPAAPEPVVELLPTISSSSGAQASALEGSASLWSK